AAKGVCVVPISSFHSPLLGFRVTLLEVDEDQLRRTFGLIRDGIEEYCRS
ncbi:MAG: aminotransferase, partial [Cytophagales bacterium]|nr:aminotransferase [Cytophagales bacterium]